MPAMAIRRTWPTRGKRSACRWATAPLALNIFQGQYTADTALMSAAGVIIAAPIVAAFVVLQRYFINGMLEGAVR